MTLKVAIAAVMALGITTLAKADLVPYYQSGNTTASVQFGSRLRVEDIKPHYINNSQTASYAAAREIYGLRQQLSASLADFLTSEAGKIGAKASPGQLTGTLKANIQSLTPTKNVLQLSGLSYGASFSVTQKKGAFTVTCDGRVAFNNINISVQYDVDTATVDRSGDSTKVELNPSQDISSCDSSVSWIPGIGLLVDYAIEEFAEKLLRDKLSGLSEIVLSKVVGKVNDGLASMTQAFSPDLPLWAGDPYAPKVRDYLANNARYWLSGRAITLIMEAEPQANVILKGSGDMMTDGVDKSGFVFKLTFSENNAPLLTLALENKVHFGYTWVCSASNPAKRCQPDY